LFKDTNEERVMDKDEMIKLLDKHRMELHAVFSCLSNQNVVDAAYLLGGMIARLDDWKIRKEKNKDK